MTRLAGGFIRDAASRSSNSEEQKKAGEARNLDTVLSSPRSMLNPPRQFSGASSHGTSFGGRPAANECQQQTTARATGRRR
jgi:hypothetical protein